MSFKVITIDALATSVSVAKLAIVIVEPTPVHVANLFPGYEVICS
jgi:hypothetical protein